MPKVILPVTDIDNTVRRRVVDDVIRDLISWTGIDPETDIQFSGESQEANQPGSTLQDEGDKNNFGHSSRAFIEVSETFRDDEVITQAFRTPGAPYVLMDEQLGVYMRPVYASMQLSINVKLRGRDRVQLRSWRDQIQYRLGSGVRSFVHGPVKFHYDIPEVAMVILKEIQRLKENNAGYGEELHQWFSRIGSERNSILVNVAGKGETWSVTESSVRVQGGFDFPDIPDEGSVGEGNSTREIDFTYTLHYDSPKTVELVYPVSIHNQLIRYRPTTNRERSIITPAASGWSLDGLQHFENNRWFFTMRNYQGVTIPAFDDFTPISPHYRCIRIVSALMLVKPETRLLMDLTKLGKYKLSPHLLDFLRTEYPYVSKPRHSVFQLHLFKNHTLVNEYDETIYLDENLQVWTKTELSSRDRWHVRLSLVRDIDIVNKNAWDRLSTNACLVREVMTSYRPFHDYSYIVGVDSPCGQLPRGMMDDLLEDVRDPSAAKSSHKSMRTVGTFVVQTNHAP